MRELRLMTSLVIAALVFFIGCATPSLKDYEPRSSDEESIKELLMAFKDGWNQRDVAAVLEACHKDAQIMTGRERTIVSKEKYGGMLPERFERLGSMEFGVPKIRITGNKAEVEVTARYSRTEVEPRISLSMVRENSSWLIMRTSY